MTERQMESARRNLEKRRPGFTPEGLERLREAAYRHHPWQHSTGPRTPEGKRRCRLNALSTGQKCRTVEPYATVGRLCRRLKACLYFRLWLVWPFYLAKKMNRKLPDDWIFNIERSWQSTEQREIRRLLPLFRMLGRMFGMTPEAVEQIPRRIDRWMYAIVCQQESPGDEAAHRCQAMFHGAIKDYLLESLFLEMDGRFDHRWKPPRHVWESFFDDSGRGRTKPAGVVAQGPSEGDARPARLLLGC